MNSEIAREARIPNPKLAALEAFIGTWTTIGHHSMIPGVTLHGRTKFDWHEGGAFLRISTMIDEPKVPSGIFLLGSDDDADSLTMIYFDERTVSRKYEASIEGNVLRWWRNAPGFSQRYILTMSGDGESLRGLSSLSKDDKTWEQDMELSYSREK